MFPGIDGFHWSPVHIVFLTAFGLVLTVLSSTLALALFRTMRDLRKGRQPAIAWHTDFEDLPASERRCRHSFDGTAPGRLCDRCFDCRRCSTHAELNATGAANLAAPFNGRLHHRGHAWVEPQPDGTALVGLDELGASAFGKPDRIELPAPGTCLTVNAPAWKLARGSRTVAIRSPLDGEVVETGAPGGAWVLRMRPENSAAAFAHLLSGSEASAWMRAETDRLMMLLSSPQTGAVLADGGQLAADLHQSMPSAPWEEISDSLLLNL